jgi:hypothetical protein
MAPDHEGMAGLMSIRPHPVPALAPQENNTFTLCLTMLMAAVYGIRKREGHRCPFLQKQVPFYAGQC